jgi:hypothetical protein
MESLNLLMVRLVMNEFLMAQQIIVTILVTEPLQQFVGILLQNLENNVMMVSMGMTLMDVLIVVSLSAH